MDSKLLDYIIHRVLEYVSAKEQELAVSTLTKIQKKGGFSPQKAPLKNPTFPLLTANLSLDAK